MLQLTTDARPGHVGYCQLIILIPNDLNQPLLDDFSTPEYTTYGVVKQDKWER
jgi:hypothetical protein